LAAQKTHEYCAPCHPEQVSDFRSHPHFRKHLDCDACHGASEKHRTASGAAAPDRVAAPDQVPALCGACHQPAAKEYSAGRHGRLVLARARTRAANCTTCHGVHNLRTFAAMQQQCRRCHASLSAGHPRTGDAACTSCHRGHTLKT
jgi:hypothetical protein